jgi:hypothetical protein
MIEGAQNRKIKGEDEPGRGGRAWCRQARAGRAASSPRSPAPLRQGHRPKRKQWMTWRMARWRRRRRVVPGASTGSPLPFDCVWAEPDWARSDPITKTRSGPNRGQIFGFPNLQHRSRSLARPHNSEEWQWRAPAATQSCHRPLSSPLRSSRVTELPLSAEEPAGQVKVSFLSLLERTHSLSWAANLPNFALLLPCYILLLVHKIMLTQHLALQMNGHFDNKCLVISVLRLTFCVIGMVVFQCDPRSGVARKTTVQRKAKTCHLPRARM